MPQLVKNLPAIREIWVRSLGWEDPLEKGTATHSNILAWRIPWTVACVVTNSRTQLSDFHFDYPWAVLNLFSTQQPEGVFQNQSQVMALLCSEPSRGSLQWWARLQLTSAHTHCIIHCSPHPSLTLPQTLLWTNTLELRPLPWLLPLPGVLYPESDWVPRFLQIFLKDHLLSHKKRTK